jgi:hypothetical protein
MALAACSELAASDSLTSLTALANRRGWTVAAENSNMSVKVGGGCVCSMEVAENRVMQKQVLCNG